MRPCCLSGRFEWGDGGIAGEAAVRDLNVPARQWIVSSQGFDQSNYCSIARFPRFSKGKPIGPLASAVPTLSAQHHNDLQASGSAVARPCHMSEQVGTALGE